MAETVTVQEAYDTGAKAFDNGDNFQQTPDHYTSVQKDLWEAGFSERSLEVYGNQSSLQTD